MRLGLSLCVPHNCHCGTLVDAQGLHAMVCKKAPGKIARHHVFNDIICRAVGAAGIPAVKEPSGLDRQDGKRPDGLTLIPWHCGRSLVWDVTVVSPLAASYVDRAATDAGTEADMTATRKTEKYSTLSSAYRFEPIAVENLGVFCSTTLNFISELGRRICVHTGDARQNFVLIPTHFYHATTLQLCAFARHSAS